MCRGIFHQFKITFGALALLGALTVACLAEEATGEWREISAGAEATSSYWSLYSTSTFAIGGTLSEDGFRFRTSGGYGQYAYRGRQDTQFHGQTSFSDVLVGYQAQLGSVTIKGFAGGSGIMHRLTPLDPDNAISGLDLGFKAALEIWANVSDTVWIAADGSWTAAFDSYVTRLRGGWRFTPELSVGLEGGFVGNAGFDGARAGGFVRYAPGWGEVSVTGGVSGDYDRPDQPFGMVSLLVRY